MNLFAEAIASHLHCLDLKIADEGGQDPTNASHWGVVACLPRAEGEEARILVSACRRATEGWGRKVFGEVAPPLIDGDPHPTTAKVIRALRDENRRLRARLDAAVLRSATTEVGPRRSDGHGGYGG